MQAQVRAIAYLHLARFGVDVPAEVREDPNRLLPASAFADALRQLAARDGPQAMERVAESMVASWRRTFPTLARYLRGRPDRCLNLWAEEVYPFLRGDRLAARVERLEPGRVRVLLHDDLPGAFLATLVARFTEVSGATAHATAAQGVLDVRYAVPPQDRLVSLLWLLGTLRVPLLLAAAVGAATGIAAAAALGMVDAVRALLLVAGVVSAQAGASALQELRRPPAVGPLGPPRPPRAFWVFQAAGGYTVGAGVAAWLALEAPAVLVPTFLGLVVGLAYPRVNDVGWGPALAGVTYGPLVVTGSVLALQPDVAWPAVAHAALWSLPVAFLAAATIFIGDLADRPLDEAGGRRTLAVRLPRGEHLGVFAALLAGGLAGLLPHAWRAGATGLLLVPLAVVAALLVRHVRRHLDDPRNLAPARLGTAGLHVCVALALALLLVQP